MEMDKRLEKKIRQVEARAASTFVEGIGKPSAVRERGFVREAYARGVADLSIAILQAVQNNDLAMLESIMVETDSESLWNFRKYRQ